MENDAHVKKLHTDLLRSKWAIFAIVGFLTLLTYLLITVSKQVSVQESLINTAPRASEPTGILWPTITPTPGGPEGRPFPTPTGTYPTTHPTRTPIYPSGTPAPKYYPTPTLRPQPTSSGPIIPIDPQPTYATE